MATTALRVAIITRAAAVTPIHMCGSPCHVAGATMAISTDTDMYLSKISIRGVILTWDIIHTPPTRIASVTAAMTSTATTAAIVSTGVASVMLVRPRGACREGSRNDVSARR
jgi:hypothetical protein